MKKLIKDLTQDEVKRICKKHLDENNGHCVGCLFYDNTFFRYITCVDIPEEIKKFNEASNKEVEIPEVEE